MTLTLEHAQRFIDQGFSVIPCRHGRKEPDARAIRWVTGQDGWLEFQTRQATPEELRVMFSTVLVNIGVVGGYGGLTVLDFDDAGLWWEWHEQHPIRTYSVMTARGVHAYFRTRVIGPCRRAPGIDLKGFGGYVLGVPSIHPSGWQYSVLDDAPVLELDTIDAVLPAGMFPPVEQPKPAKIDPTVILQPAGTDPWARLMQTPADKIQAIRARFSILDFFPDAKPTSSNAHWFMALCPFHEDHHPSFWIDTARGLCGCFSCQGKPMDVINLFASLQGLSNAEAIKRLGAAL